MMIFCMFFQPGNSIKYTSMRTPDNNENLINNNNNFTETTTSLPQCKHCGMPMCDICYSKLHKFNSQDDKQYSIEKESSVLYFHLDECNILQRAGFKNVQLKNHKAIQHGIRRIVWHHTSHNCSSCMHSEQGSL